MSCILLKRLTLNIVLFLSLYFEHRKHNKTLDKIIDMLEKIKQGVKS